ncbi:hypothetical protein ACWJKU_11140 [Methylocaldum sp. MU1018]
MADLIETPQWEPGIYQLETSDPVLGGPGGISNRQAEQLANRTQFLKGLAETLNDGKQTADALLDALAALATAADQMFYCTGPDTVALTSLTAFARALLGAVDATTARGTLGAAPLASPAFTGSPTAPTQAEGDNSTKVATTAFVQTAVAPKAPLASPAFTGSPTAPTQAGGDNSTKVATTAFVQTAVAPKAPLASPAFTGSPTAPTQAGGDNSTKLATTAFVQTAVAPKAPLASPAFTGSPTAPTPAQFDNSTKIANTAFVRSRGMSFSGCTQVTSETTLTPDYAGKCIFLFGTSYIVALPDAGDVPPGSMLSFYNTSGSIEIVAQAGDAILVNNKSVTDLTLLPGDTMSMVSDGDNVWIVVSGHVQVRNGETFKAGRSAWTYKDIVPSAADQTYTNILTFTSPCSGRIHAWAVANSSAPQPVSHYHEVTINGSTYMTDGTQLGMTEMGAASVLGGVPCTVTQKIVTGGAGNSIRMGLMYLFVPA